MQGWFPVAMRRFVSPLSDAVYIVVHIACKHNVPASRVLTSMTIMESEWIVGLPLTLKWLYVTLSSASRDVDVEIVVSPWHLPRYVTRWMQGAFVFAATIAAMIAAIGYNDSLCIQPHAVVSTTMQIWANHNRRDRTMNIHDVCDCRLLPPNIATVAAVELVAVTNGGSRWSGGRAAFLGLGLCH